MKLLKPNGIKFAALVVISLTAYSHVQAQSVLRGGVKAKFGVDGDIEADTCYNGPGASLSNKGLTSHDWFDFITRSGGTGVGIIDTTGAYNINLAKQANPATTTFFRRLRFPQHAIIDSVMMVDAVYGADRAGGSDTIYNAGTVLGGPGTWTVKSGSSPGKSDIVDFASHIRRKGSTYKDSLWMYLGMSFGSTNGSKEGTMELFVDDVRRSGLGFTGYGSEEGRKAWRFNTAGEVIVPGDMMISWEYNAASGGSFSISPYIWMADSNRLVGNAAYRTPANFVYNTTGPDPWAKSSGSSKYGFQKIGPLSGASFAYAAVSDNNPKALPFGTATGNTGTYSNSFADDQFVEFGMNLTALGVDPTTFEAINVNPCGVSFRTIVYRTMSANIFNSDMKDIAGPYPFWRSVFTPSTRHDTFDCLHTTSTFDLPDTSNVIFYNWSALPGTAEIGSLNPDSSMTTSKPGKYLLEFATETCVTFVDTITILQDTAHPIAKVTISDTLLEGSVYSVVLYGGDTAATYARLNLDSAIFGPSQGLLWEWTGVNGFSSPLQFPDATDSGKYFLTLTEKRNGCSSIDSGFLVMLPVEFSSFHCSRTPQGVQLDWETVSENDVKNFECQKWNGMRYETIGLVSSNGNIGMRNNYLFIDAKPLPGPNIYRVAAVNTAGNRTYTEPCLTNISTQKETGAFMFGVYPNPGEADVTVYSAFHSAATVPVFLSDLSGKVIRKEMLQFNDAGLATMNLSDLNSGMYLLGVADGEYPQTTRIIKK